MELSQKVDRPVVAERAHTKVRMAAMTKYCFFRSKLFVRTALGHLGCLFCSIYLLFDIRALTGAYLYSPKLRCAILAVLFFPVLIA